MTAIGEREALVVAATQHEREVQEALTDLKHAVRDTLSFGEHLRAHMGQHPLPWLGTGLLIGFWLGTRR
ncbi:MAG: hypothetical protein AB7V27_05450 [Candidatus Binatia bacterium]